MSKTTTEDHFAVSTGTSGFSTSLYTFYKATSGGMLALTAERWEGNEWEPRQLRQLTDPSDPDRQELRDSGRYAKIKRSDWSALVSALRNCETCELDLNDKLE